MMEVIGYNNNNNNSNNMVANNDDGKNYHQEIRQRTSETARSIKRKKVQTNYVDKGFFTKQNDHSVFNRRSEYSVHGNKDRKCNVLNSDCDSISLISKRSLSCDHLLNKSIEAQYRSNQCDHLSNSNINVVSSGYIRIYCGPYRDVIDYEEPSRIVNVSSAATTDQVMSDLDLPIDYTLWVSDRYKLKKKQITSSNLHKISIEK